MLYFWEVFLRNEKKMATAAFMPAAAETIAAYSQKPGFGPFFSLNDGCKQRQGGALEYLPDRHPQGSLSDRHSYHLTGF
jgi:hypothetical protein